MATESQRNARLSRQNKNLSDRLAGAEDKLARIDAHLARVSARPFVVQPWRLINDIAAVVYEAGE